MREMLEPVFGESGAAVAQFFVILVVILALLGLGYWLLQRFGGISLGHSGRGRAPRLGIVDAMSIDGRHKLVLIRRDNVEHLILIGKTTDLVVEPSIVRSTSAGHRPRQAGQPTRPQPPQQQKAPPRDPQSPVAAPARPPEPPAPPAPLARADTSEPAEPIPFPQARRQQPRQAPRTDEASEAANEESAVAEMAQQRRPTARRAQTVSGAMSVAAAANVQPVQATAHFEEPSRPNHVEPAFSLSEALDDIGDVRPATPETVAPNQSKAASVAQSASPSESVAVKPVARVEKSETPSEPNTEGTHAVANDDTSGEAVALADDVEENRQDSATKVSNLEQEMARLLGQITANRDS